MIKFEVASQSSQSFCRNRKLAFQHVRSSRHDSTVNDHCKQSQARLLAVCTLVVNIGDAYMSFEFNSILQYFMIYTH